MSLFFFVIYLFNPPLGLAFDKSDPSVSLLQNRISNNFSIKYCQAIQNGFSKDEAMKSAIVKTENIISFSFNPQKKWIEKDDLAKQISLKVVNDCGWSFGLIGKEGVDYFKSYFLEIYEKTTPEKNFSK
ncbi:putative ATP synthase protein 8 precursor [Prochlorococcus marinus str. MIT 9302]|uniref:Putative ATP synthase protein 8 n=1 Tax=Prochlorococcus marinus str. MIT 9302 TaxID=74545 RepID=A0A0A2ADW2_PROMR|nr:putative ATP synthase protein 8 precursor [Prochlorococcus marinus str. MIT 9302]